MKRMFHRLLALMACLALLIPTALSEEGDALPSPAPTDEVYADMAEDSGAYGELDEFELEAPEEQTLMTEDMRSAAEEAPGGTLPEDAAPEEPNAGNAELPPEVAAPGDRTELSGWVGGNPLEFANAVNASDWGRFYDAYNYNNNGYAADVFTFVHYTRNDNPPTFRLICVSPYSWAADAIEVWNDSGCCLLGLYPGMYGSDIKATLEGWGWTTIGVGSETAVYSNGNGYYFQVFAPYDGMGLSTGLSFFNQRFKSYYDGWRPDEGFLGNQDAWSVSLSPSQNIEVLPGQYFCLIPYTQPDRAIMGMGWTCSDGNVVGMNQSVGRGIFVALNPGVAELSAVTVNGTRASLLVRAVDPNNPPQDPTLTAYSLTLGTGEQYNLADSVEGCVFSSDNESVAWVDANGTVTAASPGTAVISATDPFGHSASCLVTVNTPPTKLKLNKKKLKLTTIGTARLKPTLTGGTAEVRFKSSNRRVASVDADGTVHGHTIGTATITATTFNGLKATCKVTVSRAKSKSVKYRALLVGECDFPGTGNDSLPSRNDVSLMYNALKSVKGPCGNKWKVYSVINRTSSQILTDIRNAFYGAKETDVSLFYIGTHGNTSASIYNNYNNAGRLSTYPDAYGNSSLSLPELADCLREIPGKIIVIIDSCGSGAAIYNAKGGPATGFDPDEFNDAVLDAFAAADTGILAPGDGTGAFALENKFYVMTASAYQELSWTQGGKYPCSYFTKWMSDAVGRKGKMAADKNKNKYLTLKEFYSYVSKKAKNTTMRDNGKTYRQHTKVYPTGSAFELFYRK